MSVNASGLVAIAEGDVGRAEIGSTNRSPWLDPIQRAVSLAHGWPSGFLLGQPWCGTWAYDVGRRAGFAHADNPWHPSTETMWVRAQSTGTLTSQPRVGAAIVWRGVHTGIVAAVNTAAGVVHTIEGNSSNQVARRVRALNGTHRYIVPPLLVQRMPTVTEFWLEDLRAEYRVWGPWRAKGSAERALAGMPAARRARAQVLRAGDGRYVVREGQPRHYGPWLAQAGRDRAQTVLEARLGRRLRRWSRTRPAPGITTPAGAPEALGRTV